jgi:hypothetical protein
MIKYIIYIKNTIEWILNGTERGINCIANLFKYAAKLAISCCICYIIAYWHPLNYIHNLFTKKTIIENIVIEKPVNKFAYSIRFIKNVLTFKN